MGDAEDGEAVAHAETMFLLVCCENIFWFFGSCNALGRIRGPWPTGRSAGGLLTHLPTRFLSLNLLCVCSLDACTGK